MLAIDAILRACAESNFQPGHYLTLAIQSAISAGCGDDAAGLVDAAERECERIHAETLSNRVQCYGCKYAVIETWSDPGERVAGGMPALPDCDILQCEAQPWECPVVKTSGYADAYLEGTE